MVNATVTARSVNNRIESLGNSVTYYAPLTTVGQFNDEGDWIQAWETTSTETKWIEETQSYREEYTDLGRFPVRDARVIMKNGINLAIRGKCIVNNVNWIIEEINPIRVKDQYIAQTVIVKNLLP